MCYGPWGRKNVGLSDLKKPTWNGHFHPNPAGNFGCKLCLRIHDDEGRKAGFHTAALNSHWLRAILAPGTSSLYACRWGRDSNPKAEVRRESQVQPFRAEHTGGGTGTQKGPKHPVHLGGALIVPATTLELSDCLGKEGLGQWTFSKIQKVRFYIFEKLRIYKSAFLNILLLIHYGSRRWWQRHQRLISLW